MSAQRPLGFTLLEMMVVLAIVGVLAGIAGFSLAAAPQPGRGGTLTAARARALREGKPVADSAAPGQPTIQLPDGRTVPALTWTRRELP